MSTATGRSRTGKTAADAPAARSRSGVAARSLQTRDKLIEAAGPIFAAQGFDGAKGQDICRRARVHTAAIVYHFGGMAGLYRAVLAEAVRRLVTTEALAQAVGAQRDPHRQLEAFLGLIVGTLTRPVSQAWPGKLFGREFISPSTRYGQAHDRALAARSKLLKSIVAALTGKPVADPLVAQSCICIMAPCALLLLIDRRKLQRLLPQLDLRAGAAPGLTRHLTAFSLAGLAALRAGGAAAA